MLWFSLNQPLTLQHAQSFEQSCPTHTDRQRVFSVAALIGALLSTTFSVMLRGSAKSRSGSFCLYTCFLSQITDVYSKHAQYICFVSLLDVFFFFLIIRRPPSSPLFPSPTLFR